VMLTALWAVHLCAFEYLNQLDSNPSSVPDWDSDYKSLLPLRSSVAANTLVQL
jgi:hypothetical protein